jgi:hypothetical protein
MLSEERERPLTRRRVVTTGAKLAYAAPLVAVSFKLSARGVGAQVSSGECFHSSNIPGQGCKEACTSIGCTGEACDGCDDFPNGTQPCDACCTAPGGGNRCPSTAYCDPDCFTCTGGVAAFEC